MFKYFTADTNNQEEYAFANGRIRKLEKGLLNKDILDRMIKSSDAVSALKILTESDLNDYSFDLNNPADFENSLNKELLHTYDIIKNISKVSTFNFLYFTFASKYDFHNIKILIKSKYLKKDISNELFSPIRTIDIEKLNLAIRDEKYEDIPDSFEFLIKKTFSEYSKFKDPEKIDFILDKERYIMIFNKIKEVEIIETEELFLRRFIKINIDLNNIISCIRAKIRGERKSFTKEFLIPEGDFKIENIVEIYDSPLSSWFEKLIHTDYKDIVELGVNYFQKNNSLMELEKLRDNFILNFSKIGKYITFGIEPLVGFITAKENDIKNIRIILSGKLNKLSPDQIKERVRDTYV
ncbi:V-type ATP synthase subunit C [Candidatus Atribacteria bacterium HGW-Atribacteria-1]|nr:MAG: V-type ATP synthase subunit C [Candidatus Atribacteria bacterium HGW-Atribacteria-1]